MKRLTFALLALALVAQFSIAGTTEIVIQPGDTVVVRAGSGAPTIPPSIPTIPTTPTTPTIPPSIPTPTELGNIVPFAWTSGQNKQTIASSYGRTTILTDVPANLDLSRHNASLTGFERLAETPGYTTLNRTITVRVNGAIVFGPADLGSAPSVNFTVGNPYFYKAVGAQYNLQPGDRRLLTVDNVGLESTPYTQANFNFDFASPLRTETAASSLKRAKSAATKPAATK